MNLGSWSSYLSRFKNLLRPDGVGPLGEAEENVESVRGEDAAKIALATISAKLPDLVFEGYRDWYSYEDEWVLRNLGQVLDAQEEDEILRRLDEGTPEALQAVLDYIADDRLDAWQNIAREEFAQIAADDGPEMLMGAANTANWQASRTPGTYYYTYAGDRYLYSDLSQAPADEWETLPVRERLASENAQAWGDSEWFCTPTGEPSLYGGEFVFAPDRDGPWMTEEQAAAQIQSESEPRRYDPVEAVSGYQEWVRGYDNDERVWKFAQVTGAEIPDDDAIWTAVNTFSADGSEYFAGPGYSDSGWVPYQAEPEEQRVAEPDSATTASKMREGIVLPAIAQLKENHPDLTDEQASELIAAVTSQALLAATRPEG